MCQAEGEPCLGDSIGIETLCYKLGECRWEPASRYIVVQKTTRLANQPTERSMTHLKKLIGTTAVIALLTSPAFAANDNAASAKQPDNARAQSDDMKSKEGKARKKAEKSDETPGEEKNASRSADGEWLSLTGEVKEVRGDAFTLDYGQGEIAVEMDDYDWYNENVVKKGDRVTVTGRMDKDFVHERKVEASSVYIKPLGAYFFASAADEEDGYYAALVDFPEDDEWVSFAGKVARINGENLILDTGLIEFDVDAGNLGYDPFDREGLGRIEVGERIVVSGRMDDADLFDDREIEATSITTLSGAG